MLFKDNHDPHMLIGMLAKLYRMLLQVKYLEDKGKNQYEIAQEIKAKPFYIKKCMEKTRSFSLQELAKNLKILHLADLKMKSGSPARRTLELLIPDLCHEQ
jgi:DNA polymerase-3 subunit delta